MINVIRDRVPGISGSTWMLDVICWAQKLIQYLVIG
jgi:hypothetical protein